MAPKFPTRAKFGQNKTTSVPTMTIEPSITSLSLSSSPKHLYVYCLLLVTDHASSLLPQSHHVLVVGTNFHNSLCDSVENKNFFSRKTIQSTLHYYIFY